MRHKKALYIVCLAISLVMIGCAIVKPSYAAETVVQKGQITKVYRGNVSKKATQGSTITSKYYVYTDWKDDTSKGIVHFIDRTTGKEVGKVSGKWGHMSGLDHEWGSNYVRVLNSGDASLDGCISLTNLKVVSLSKCVSRLKKGTQTTIGNAIPSKLQQQAVPIQTNNYYLRTAYNKSGDHASYVYVFDSKGKKVKSIKIPRNLVGCAEIEDASVDKSTGDVYVSYNCNGTKNGKHVDYALFYRIDQSVFGDVTAVKNKTVAKRQAANTSKGNSSSSSTTPTKTTTSTNSATPTKTTTSTNSVTPTKTTTPTKTDTSTKETTSNAKNSTTTSKKTTQNDKSKEGEGGEGSSSKQNCTNTVIFGEVCGEDGIQKALALARNILSIGVGILGVIGITITGIQYLTAADDPAKAQKARRRLVEIIIGLVVYAVMFVALTWLGVGS